MAQIARIKMHRVIVSVCLVGLQAAGATAQTTEAGPRLIPVAGIQVRIWTAAINQRKPGTPVIALEAGAGAQLETWTPIFNELAKLGPVVAYDRLFDRANK